MDIHTIKVRPFLKKYITAVISKAITLSENQELIIDLMALCSHGDNNILIDRDGCSITLQKTYFEKTVQYVYMIPVRIQTKVKESTYSFPQEPSFYFPLAEKYFEAFLYKEILLLDYIGTDYKTKKQLRRNIDLFIAFLNNK